MDQLYFSPNPLTNLEALTYSREVRSTVETQSGICVNKVYYPKAEEWIIYSSDHRQNLAETHPQAVKLAQENKCNVLSYDYPGFGFSTGVATEETCIGALHGLLRLLARIVNVSAITLVGREVGCGVVMGVVEKISWTQPVVLISPFCSLAELYLPRWICFWNWFDNYLKIKESGLPVKIYTGIYDKEIKAYHGIKFSRLPNVKVAWYPTDYPGMLEFPWKIP